VARTERLPIRLHDGERQGWERAQAELGYRTLSDLVRLSVDTTVVFEPQVRALGFASLAEFVSEAIAAVGPPPEGMVPEFVPDVVDDDGV
jgi:hypothetical protein